MAYIEKVTSPDMTTRDILRQERYIRMMCKMEMG